MIYKIDMMNMMNRIKNIKQTASIAMVRVLTNHILWVVRADTNHGKEQTAPSIPQRGKITAMVRVLTNHIRWVVRADTNHGKENHGKENSPFGGLRGLGGAGGLLLLVLLLFFPLWGMKGAEADLKNQYFSILSKHINREIYILKYNIYLGDNSGVETNTLIDAIIVRNHLALYTKAGDVELLLDADGSILANHRNMQLFVNHSNPYTAQQRKALDSSLTSMINSQLFGYIEQCDSIYTTTDKHYDIYTLEFDNSEYDKIEYWFDKTGQIKYLWLFFKEGDYKYQKIEYETLKNNNKELLDRTDKPYFITDDGQPGSNFKNFKLRYNEE
jgi:hypothetical protein